ncbi:MAG: glycosyltransferase family 2 protein [Candidatus Woesearchaeota archaeon]
MKDKNPLVSVIIPTYNRERTIKRAIDSVFNQTYKNWELIIVDDGSTDNTKEVIKDYLKDKRVKYFAKKNAGVSSARNLGVKKSTGKFISFLDSDDEFLHNKIEIQLNKILKNSLDFSLCQEIQVIEGKEITVSPFKNVKIFDESLFLRKNISHSASLFLFRKKSFKVFDEKLGAMEDTDLILRTLKEFSCGVIPDILVKRYKTISENRLSSNNSIKIKGYERLLVKINNQDYNLDKETTLHFVSNINFNLGLFYMLNNDYKKCRLYFKKNVISNYKFFMFERFLINLSYFPFLLKFIIFLAKKLWRLGIIKIK